MRILTVICLAVSYSGGIESPYCSDPDDYQVGVGCCPLCRPGWHFVEHCTADSSTKCSKCPDGTFQKYLNKEKQCSTCSCGADLGLKVTESCTSKSNAKCEVLDGFFCSDSRRGGCRRHRLSCSPGHYIGQKGTADKDTECLHCTDGTFSNGISTSCQNHTKCESKELKLMRPGTDSTDSECGEHGPETELVLGVISGVMLVMALIIIAIIHRKKIRKWRLTWRLTSKMETKSKELSQCCCLTGFYSPAPTGDQQEHSTTTRAAPMDDHDGDQSLGPDPPQVPHNGSVSLPQHPEVNQTVLFRKDGGQVLCPSQSESPLPVHPPHSGAPLPLPVPPPQSGSPPPLPVPPPQSGSPLPLPAHPPQSG